MRRVYRDSEVVTLTETGTERANFNEGRTASRRLSRVLGSLGIEQGDRVATFAWNSQRHLEVYLAAPCIGAVLHTLNIRLFEEQLTYVANHAEDQIVFVDDTLVPILEKVAPTFETVRHYVVMGDGDCGSLPNALSYEELLAEQPDGFDYPELADRRRRGSATRAARPATPKGCSIRTGQTFFTPSPPASATRWA